MVKEKKKLYLYILCQIDFIFLYFSFQAYGGSFNKVPTSKSTQSFRCQVLFCSKFAAIVTAQQRLNFQTTLLIEPSKWLVERNKFL